MITLSGLIDFFKNRKLSVINFDASPELKIIGGRNINEAGPGEMSFISSKVKDSAQKLINESRASVIIIDSGIFHTVNISKSKSVFVLTDSPKEVMVDSLKHFFMEKVLPEIHHSAVIHSDVKMGSENYIGAYVVIDTNVIIGNNCFIEPFVHIKKDTIIGNNVKIKSGAVIGGQGFGYVKKDNKWENFPHFGNVVIEDDVEIGSNTCIDRGALGSTMIKRGVKIDNLVHVAHNVYIGENSLIIADAMLGGSARIGSDTWVAPSTALRNGIEIGSGCTIGMGAIVTKSVESGTTVVGNPAKPFLNNEKK